MMVDLKHRSENEFYQSIEDVDKYITSISVSNFKTNIPRVNFRKIKLNKFQNLYSTFQSGNITRFYLDDKLLELNLPVRKTESEIILDKVNTNPLRKKKIEDEKPPLIVEVEENIQESRLPEQSLTTENPFTDLSNILEESEDLTLEESVIAKESVLKPKNTEIKKDITFDLEAQVVQKDENVLLSPSFPSTPRTEDDLISSSGEQAEFIWPPLPQKKVVKKAKSKKSKKKPYFLSEESKPSEQLEEKSKIVESKVSETLNFPWTLTQKDDSQIEEIFGGGLESELLDTSSYPENRQEAESEKIEDRELEIEFREDKQEEQKIYKEKLENTSQTIENLPFAGKAVYKALFPNVSFEPLPENIINDALKNIGWFSKLLDRFNNLEFGIVVTGNTEKKGEKKVGNMFEKFGYKLTPIRIIILGGALATLGYSVWNYLLPIINSNSINQIKNKKVIVKNLFKIKNIQTSNKAVIGEKEEKLQIAENLEEKTFSPITEQERQALILMAREALESRLDPFGQEEVLPKEVLQQKSEEQNTGPREISLDRQQVELVGVISANNKNLALVNIYNADYKVIEDDDKAARDSKLKTALSMAVPNRLEVSLLDPVDEWYVKQIVKGKAKGDDPMIELVKGDKKFKLKVGQKVLLPEEKPPEEPIVEDKMDASEE